MSRIPIRKAKQLDDLNEKEMVEGYLDGFQNEPQPGDNRSYSYWHGWRNGMVDGKHAEGDGAQAALAHDVVKTGYLRQS